MTDDPAEHFKRASGLFERASGAMARLGLADFAEAEAVAADPCFGALRRLADDPAVAPLELLTAAAAAGLLPGRQPPEDLAEAAARKRDLLQHLERRDFRVRPAAAGDLPALQLLERRCWPRGLRTPKAVLARRIARHPEGQLVLLVGEILAGVIYSQRIAEAGALEGMTAARVDRLHDPAGATVQLLAVNILPEMQERTLGDQLLELMLVRCSLEPGVEAVVAVTLCRNFDAAEGVSLADYLARRNAQGVLADPILRFHELHGATVERPLPGYRPADLKNQGCGVLVRYDIHRRRRRDLLASPPGRAPQAAGKTPSRAAIRAGVEASVGACLGEGGQAAFAFDRPLMEMGLDSAGLLELGERLAHRFGVALSPGFFFRFNTAGKVADHLCEELAPVRARPAKGRGRAARPAKAAKGGADSPEAALRDAGARDVAVVGLACRLPGGLDTPEDLWACLRDGRSVLGELPAGRWRWPAGIEPEGRHRGIARGGFLEDVAAFDAPFFRISPAEAETMDPQQRLLLELCWQAIEQAGYAPAALAGSRTGVFVGASGSDYARLLDRSERPTEAHYGTGSAMAVLANRISYFYDLNGPSLLLDTACSSSLVALHEAVRSLADGESEQALVAGVNLLLHPANTLAYYQAGMLSKQGQCRPFDAEADGYLRSEGAVVLLLKPLAAALADGDRVQAVIKGTACNHGGQAGGLTVPNPEQQARLLRAAWRAAGIEPTDLGYLEAHGTGTPLGDPLEVQGILQAFAEAGAERPPSAAPCGLGSVKSNLGHLEAAAGLAGLLKAVLCLQRRALPASLHLRRLNPEIALDGSGLEIVERLRPWAAPAAGAPRLAGVSSFGSGGTNAHVVVAEAPQVPEAGAQAGSAAGADEGPLLFLLSARTPAQLQAYARRYLDWLTAGPGRSVPLADLAWQLQTGRQALEERLALVVAGREELVAALNAFCADPARGHSTQGATANRATPGRFGELTRGEAGWAFVEALAAEGDLERLGLLWLAGAEVDWSLLHPSGAPARRRLDVPTYPFARHAYWLPGEPLPAEVGAAGEEVPSGETEGPPAILLAPVWRALSARETLPEALFPAPEARVLAIGPSNWKERAGAALPASTQWLEIDPEASIPVLTDRLRALEPFDRILWLARPEPAGEAALLERQESGLLFLFRLVKALLALSRDERPLDWTAVTWRSQAVFGSERPEPADAGVPGFLGALAGEVPLWRVRCLDLEDAQDWPLPDLPSAETAPSGEVLARRSGQWFRRRLGPVEALPDGPPAYRQNGVYVVVGGAGGVGEAWTRHLVEHFQAQVVWIGRRPADAAIRAKLQALAALGPAPLYLAADASDPAALAAAHAEIKRRWPAVHGVVQAAVGAFDRSLAETEEAHFREVLSAKVEASVRVAQAFEDEPLDFLLFFSSVVALERNGGLSGYAAGGAFADALALSLRGRRPYPVQVVNWGHWQIGSAAALSEAAKTRLRLGGVLPIRPDEAMEALQRLLGAPLGQVALLRNRRIEALPLVDTARSLRVQAGPAVPRPLPAPVAATAAEVESLKPVSLFANVALEARLADLFAATLNSLGLTEGSESGPAGFHGQWLEAGRALLAERAGAAPPDLAQAWRDWEAAKAAELAGPDLEAAVALAEDCLRRLPEILSGRLRATDLLFPEASMARVEGVYGGNAVADHFNGQLAEALAAAVEARQREEPRARLRILEVGAGTGSTTALVLPRLAPYAGRIAEYAFTDLSKAFLFHAEARFGDCPFLRPRLFDLERPLAGQGLEAGAYDLVVATNVLHATRDIRRTLAGCKAALGRGGLLLLNELAGRSLFAHLTFGLLEGWWLAEDRPLRMPGAPGLYPETWRRVLAQEGFDEVSFADPHSHVLGQQVILARSDGLAWQQARPAAAAPVAPAAPAGEEAQEAGAVPELKRAAEQHLRRLVAKVLRMDPEALDPREPLEAYGIDSILIGQITAALRGSFPEVGATLLFECQTVGALADHLLRTSRDRVRRVTGLSEVPAPPAASPVAAPLSGPPASAVAEAAPEPIAVIGMSCRFPQADGLEAYWRVLSAGESCIREVPADRWPLEGFFEADSEVAVAQGRSYGKWGGFLEEVTAFDPLFFNISPKEAVGIDPQERLFLQTAWATLEDAGYTRERLARDFDRRLGVFVGITRTGFDLFGPDLWRRGERLQPHTSFSSVANRLSYFLDARGPSVPVDTMCSSSLTAIHQACQSLRAGECRLALAGGVNLYLHPSGYVGLSASRMLSPDGLCRSFGKGGKGFVPGEGVGAVLLKPLSRALADGDRIYATIRATHVNHGGKTNGYTVPNPLAQAELVGEALRKAGLGARAVSCLEAHGTGTELGDPIEVAGLTRAFRETTQDSGFCSLGSAKSTIGHLEAAAGIAGFIKVVLQLRHRQLAPSLHAAETNPEIDFAATPFFVQQALADWPRPRLPGPQGPEEAPRIAGLSSFGAGGANAHVILEEYEEPEAPSAEAGRFPIVLSARSEERLKAYAARLADFLAARLAAGEAPELADLAYTLQVGREAMDHRLGLVADSPEALRARLEAFAAGSEVAESGRAGLHLGHARQAREIAGAGEAALQERLAGWFAAGEHDRLLSFWTKGVSVDWEALQRGRRAAGRLPRRIALPSYPFATTRYWLPIPAAEVETAPEPAPPAQTVAAAPLPAPAATFAKPHAVVLRDPASVPTRFPQPAAAGQRTLRKLSSFGPQALEPLGQEAALVLQDLGEGLVSVGPDPADARPLDPEAACAALVACLGWLGGQGEAGSKVLLLKGLDRLLADSPSSASVRMAAEALAACALPVVAVLEGEIRGAAATLAEACDLAICSTEGTYAFGSAAALPGSELRQAGFTLPVVATDELEARALELARSIARGSAPALAALKGHLARDGSALAPRGQGGTLAADLAGPARAEAAGAPRRIALDSAVVTLEAYPDGVAVMTLCERASRNTFSPAFVEGVLEAFERIDGDPGLKVVVLTGFESYFACGGTREGLLAIQGGRARFTDEQSYSRPLACEIPVIAAMQGHAIGAGWAMGLFCDAAVYSEESVYQSPYMLYGFTPGAGSTRVFPERLGAGLGREVLLTAREYQGRELRARGLGPVLPRREVLGHALALAHRLASSSRQALVEDKRSRSAALRASLPAVFERELALHDRTFVGNPEVIERIARHFEGAAPEPATPPADRGSAPTPGALCEILRETLAAELQMAPEQIEEETPFIDLGLDSIGAVTWVRRLNERLGLSLAATRAYSHPNLLRFSAFVLAELGGDRPEAEAGTGLQDAEELRAWLRETLARELGMAPGELDEDAKFIDLGLDSIAAVTWIRAIAERYGLAVAATRVYSHPTLAEFHRHLVELGRQQGVFGGSGTPAAVAAPRAAPPAHEPVLLHAFPLTPAAAPHPAPDIPAPAVPTAATQAATTQPIAIVGMAGQFPKAGDLRQFWRNLAEGRDCVSEIPPSRWPLEDYYDADRSAPGKTVCRRMGLLEDIDRFDPLFFGIAPAEAELMDPQQRLFLENSWRCIEDAGYDPQALAGSRCGVFVGCGAGDYHQLLAGQPPSAQGLIGESVAMLPARIAYVLDLQGPCLAIDTACSASLVAIANACDSLVLGDSDLALAGGVYVVTGPDIHVKMSQAGMLSPDGRCYSFDQRANGFVPGEGVGVLLLKRLADAERDGDDIRAVIRGWGVNQDGRTNGITAPNQESQTRLEVGVYRKFVLDPERIGLVEAHGTGTKLGDPIEVEALRAAFGSFTDRRGFCALGSVKSNLGHLATAAGVTGVVKTVLALQTGLLPPTINHETPNEHIALEDSPFYVNTDCRPWPAGAGGERLAAVSSFGFSGTNAHLVLGEAPPRPPAAGMAEGPVLFPLSARSPEQLARYAGALAEWLAEEPEAASLAELAHTFQTGRPAFRHRLAILAATREELRERLSACAANDLGDPHCWTGEAGKAVPPTSARAPGPADLAGLAARWVAGEPVEWRRLHRPGQARRRHGLPSYPFARERYWVPEAASAAEPAKVPAEKTAAEPGPWRRSALPEGLDWQGRLRERLDGEILVVGDEASAEGRALAALLGRLAEAAALSAQPRLRFCRAEALAPEPAPDWAILLAEEAGGEQTSALVSRLAAGAGRLALFARADAATAERLGAALAAEPSGARRPLLLVGQDDTSDAAAAMQRLVTEWLACEGQDGLSEVRYEGDRRFCRVARAETGVERLCRLEVDWRPKAPVPAEPPLRRRTLLLLVNEETCELAGRLFEPGDFERVVLVGDASVPAGRLDNVIDFADPAAARIGARILLDRFEDIDHLVDLGALHEAPAEEDEDPAGRTLFYQALVGTCRDLSILYLTKGLLPFRCERMSLAGARFAGLVAMLGAEYRQVAARVLDIDQATQDDPPLLRRLLLQELGSALQETTLCVREGARFAPLLAAEAAGSGGLDSLELNPLELDPLELDEEAVYVVSGGTNGVGLEIAGHLADRGCRKLVLMGVTPLPPRESWAQALEQEALEPYLADKLRALLALEARLEQLEVYTGSLAVRDALRHYFVRVRATLGPIRGVVHAAALYSDPATPAFAAKSLESLRAVWEPKAEGLESLHAVFKADPLDFFVSFVSLTGLVPHLARGAADYAMANAFVDFFTTYQHRQHERRCYRTILWSDWNETGGITRVAPERAAAVRETFARLGLRTFSNREGRALFDRAMGEGLGSRVIVGYLDPRRFEQVRPQLLHAQPAMPEPVMPKPAGSEPEGPAALLLGHLERWEAEKRAGRAVPPREITAVVGLPEIRRLAPALIHRLHALLFGAAAPVAEGAPVETPAAVRTPAESAPAESAPTESARVIAETVREVLKLKTLDPAQPFQSYGLDSISAMVLSTRLEKRLGRELPPQWLIEHPTVERLSRHLAAQGASPQAGTSQPSGGTL
ncbi:MAG: SDR family NAD(P)-dependent oxidoreductase [Tistlia sp.]|uniref:SDR family NAD(P)-dependent oxidoreductase n=1 Tax=Tistlia sp. TaxID=3057121 RepID=UPI0034A50A52